MGEDIEVFLRQNNVPVIYEEDFKETVHHLIAFYRGEEGAANGLTYEEMS